MKKVINTSGLDRTAACLQWLTGQNVPAYDSGTGYIPGDMVKLADHSLWRCIADTTGNTPPNTTYWVTANVNGERNPLFRDLVFLGPPIDYPAQNYPSDGQNTSIANYGAYPIVDSDAPLKYAGITYQPFAVSKPKFSYKTGFEASSVSVDVTPRENPQVVGSNPTYTRGDGTSYSEGFNSNLPYYDPYVNSSDGSSLTAFQTMKQSFVSGDWYQAPITVTRVFMPSPFDVTSYGGAVLFRGRVSDLQVDRLKISVKAQSLMQIFTQKVPTQIFAPGNRFLAWDFSSSADYSGGHTSSGSYNWATVDFGTTLDDGVLAEGYAIITDTQRGVWKRRIFNNVGNTVYLYESMPMVLTTFSEMACFKAGNTSFTSGMPGQGFPYLPPPTSGAGGVI